MERCWVLLQRPMAVLLLPLLLLSSRVAADGWQLKVRRHPARTIRPTSIRYAGVLFPTPCKCDVAIAMRCVTSACQQLVNLSRLQHLHVAAPFVVQDLPPVEQALTPCCMFAE